MSRSFILASQSTSRQAMLKAAGIVFDAHPAHVDEASLKTALLDAEQKPRSIADALAEAKAIKVSARYPGALVLGSDQILETDTGELLSKPDSPAEAKEQLHGLSGKRHFLWSAAVLAEQGTPIWRHVDKAELDVRPLSEGFVDNYVDRNWESIRYTVGCYAIEAEGVHLFSQIKGSHFTIQGLPLLAVLAQLRILGVIPS